MPGLSPICRAWRYSERGAGRPPDLSTRLAPPYDLVSADVKRRLLAADPTCAASIDVPHLPVDRVGPETSYRRARETFDQWRTDGTLHALDRPVLGVLRQTFRDGSSVLRRHALLADLPLEALGGSAGLFAHEETRSGPRGDRFALLRALRVQTSPIFGLFSDSDGSVEEARVAVEFASEPTLVGLAMDRTLSELWLVEDESLISGLLEAFGRRDVIIADGHHRYVSQLEYVESLGSAAPAAARTCVFALVAQEDTGMSIRAMHHVLGGIEEYRIEAVMAALSDACRFEEAPGGAVDLVDRVARAWFERSNPVGLIDFATRRCFIMTSRVIDPLVEKFPEAPEAWRRCGPVVCEHLLVQRTLRDRLNGGREPLRQPVFDAADLEAGPSILPGAQLGLVMLPVSLADVLTIAPSGRLLPANSTFFWPKMPTGLIFKSLE